MVNLQGCHFLRPDALTNLNPVPLPPNSITDRLKFLEDRIVQLERDFPPWAALHLNQPNREVVVGIGHLPTQLLTSVRLVATAPATNTDYRSTSNVGNLRPQFDTC